MADKKVVSADEWQKMKPSRVAISTDKKSDSYVLSRRVREVLKRCHGKRRLLIGNSFIKQFTLKVRRLLSPDTL